MSHLSAEPVHLDEDEIRAITHYKQPAAQARALARLQVPYTRRKDGTLLVGRDHMREGLGMPIQKPAMTRAANDEPKWSKQA